MFVLYGRDNCSYCKDALEHIRVNFPNEEIEYIDYTKNENTKRYLKEELKATTVPQIFHEYLEDLVGMCYTPVKVHIGGYDQLVEYTKKWYSVAA